MRLFLAVLRHFCPSEVCRYQKFFLIKNPVVARVSER